MPLDIAPFQARRARLLQTMQEAGGGVAIIPTAPERVRNRDTHHSYRFDSYFYYLTGFREPEAVLVLVAGDAPRSLLFCRSKDIEREIWDGYRHGPNACVLHYVENDRQMQHGELILIDAGCELDGYASDITRSFPVNGRFSGPQKAVYELVLAAQAAAIDKVRPGLDWNAAHDAATRVLAQGFLDLGLLQGSLDGVLEAGSYRQFYMHRTGHWLGLDVHDAGSYQTGGQWRLLAPGNVLTVEPGAYIRPAEGVPEAFWNIGVRIEDNVLVTPEGNDIITIATPKTIAEIEALMREAPHAKA